MRTQRIKRVCGHLAAAFALACAIIPNAWSQAPDIQQSSQEALRQMQESGRRTQEVLMQAQQNFAQGLRDGMESARRQREQTQRDLQEMEDRREERQRRWREEERAERAEADAIHAQLLAQQQRAAAEKLRKDVSDFDGLGSLMGRFGSSRPTAKALANDSQGQEAQAAAGLEQLRMDLQRRSTGKKSASDSTGVDSKPAKVLINKENLARLATLIQEEQRTEAAALVSEMIQNNPDDPRVPQLKNLLQSLKDSPEAPN